MIDTHCHILPGVDDGARDLTEALEMARVAVNDGIQTIIVTPHVAEYELTGAKQRIARHVVAFQSALQENNISLKVITGAEVRVTPELSQGLSMDDLPVIGESRAILIELPFGEVPSYLGQLIFDLRLAGVTPIIAHPERNRIFAQEPNRILSYLEQGALTQINAGSLMGTFGDTVKKAAHIMIKHNMAHMIGSDAHRAERQRRPVLSVCRQSLSEFISKECIDELFSINAQTIMEGRGLRQREPVEYRPYKKGLLQLIWGFVRNN